MSDECKTRNNRTFPTNLSGDVEAICNIEKWKHCEVSEYVEIGNITLGPDKDILYRPVGFAHKGPWVDNGHYIAYLREGSGDWLRMDDQANQIQRIRDAQMREETKGNQYFLVYERVYGAKKG